MNFRDHGSLLPILIILLCLDPSGAAIRIKRKHNEITSHSKYLFSLYNISLENYQNLGYDTQLFIGSLNAAFDMQFDTSTPWIWIPEASSTDPNFLNRYNCSQSSSCIELSDGNVTLNYPQGTIYGYVVNDTVNFPRDFTLDTNSLTLNMTFVLATQIDSYFDEVCIGDGLFGMGLPTDNYTFGLVDILYNEGSITERWFSLFLTNDPDYNDDFSELIIQGYDTTYMQGNSFVYTNVANSSYWSIAIDNYSLGNVTLIPDSGDTYGILSSASVNIAINPNDMNNFFQTLTNNYNNNCGYNSSIGYYCQCVGGSLSSFPNLTIGSGSVSLSIPASQYVEYNQGDAYDGYMNEIEEIETHPMIKHRRKSKRTHPQVIMAKDLNAQQIPNSDNEYGDLCVLQIDATNSTFNYTESFEGQWILGLPILEAYYTVYNYDNMSVGFVPSIQPNFLGEGNMEVWLIVILVIASVAIVVLMVLAMTAKTKKNKSWRKQLAMQEEQRSYVRITDKKFGKRDSGVFLYNPSSKDPIWRQEKEMNSAL